MAAILVRWQVIFKQANFEKVYNGCQVKALTEINSWKNTQHYVYVTGFTENCCILKIQNVLKQTLPQIHFNSKDLILFTGFLYTPIYISV
jgi:hypothetical protein